MAIDYGSYQLNPLEGINQGLANIGQALQYRRSLKRQEMLDAENKSLRDLQMEEGRLRLGELKRENAYRTELSNLAPGETSYEMASELAQKYGKVEDAGKILNLRNENAKIQARGDLQTYYKNIRKIEEMEVFAKTIAPFVNRKELLKKLWPSISGTFPGIADKVDPETLAETSEGIVMNARTKEGEVIPQIQYIYDSKGNISVIKQSETKYEPGVKARMEFEAFANVPKDISSEELASFRAAPETQKAFANYLKPGVTGMNPYSYLTWKQKQKNAPAQAKTKTKETNSTQIIERRSREGGRTFVKLSNGKVLEEITVNGKQIFKDADGNIYGE